MDLITFQKRFGADEACRAHLELVLWPDGPVCTTCGCVDNAHRVRTRKGLWQFHVNTAEGFNATMKRAVVGVFHRISRKHPVRYACETSFRWNRRATEAPERLREMLRLARGRCLPYAVLIGATA